MSILVCADISSNPGPVLIPGMTGVSILYFSACSLVNKTAFLESQLALKGYDIVALTESHLGDTILDAELFPPNYVVYRKDRNRKGGGVLLAVRDKILATRRDCDANSEILWVDIFCGKNKSFTFK